MTKERAIHAFWNSFGVKAYEESSVPDDAEFPRITYSMESDSFENVVSMTANVWYRSTSWEGATDLTTEIAKRIKEHGHAIVPYDGGYAYIVGGNPFSQRIDDPDDTIKRIYINIQTEYLSLY